MVTQRTILLVDDDTNILSALARVLRPSGWRILRASSGRDGLALLAQNEVGVIVSDQRMPEMTGVEFLEKVRGLYPDTVRIVLSGYTDLGSITEAVNRGAIYKFITKPWDDGLLRANIEEAFRYHELKLENSRLTAQLKAANDDLALRVEQKSGEAMRNLSVLRVSQEVLESLPVAVIGIGSDGMVALANRLARELLGTETPLLGELANEVLPPQLLGPDQWVSLPVPGRTPVRLHCRHAATGRESASQGSTLVLVPESCEEGP